MAYSTGIYGNSIGYRSVDGVIRTDEQSRHLNFYVMNISYGVSVSFPVSVSSLGSFNFRAKLDQ